MDPILNVKVLDHTGYKYRVMLHVLLPEQQMILLQSSFKVYCDLKLEQ